MKKFIAIFVVMLFAAGSAQAVLINNALRHTGYHKMAEADMYLHNNGGLFAMTPYGTALLTDGPGGRGLDFNNDIDFINTGAINQADNYMNLFFGWFNAPPLSGSYAFRNAGDDDRCGIWLDLNQNGVFESSIDGLGSNRGEQLSWRDGGTKTVSLVAGQSYMFAVTHGEFTGGSSVDVRFKTPSMGSEVIIKPSDPAQAGMWTTILEEPATLVAHWKLDESSGGTAYDSSGYNHGTLEPSPTLTPPLWLPAGGWFNGALQLDGVDDYVDCGNEGSLNITGEITLAAWVKTSDSDNGQFNPYVTKGDHSYAIKHHSSNHIEFFIYDSGWHVVWCPVGSSFNDDWHHLAGTYNGSELILYVDDELSFSSYPGSIAGSTFNVNIGRNAEITDRLYDGLIDDVAIFSRALDGTEIIDLKNNGGASFIGDPNLSALWELDESGGGTAYDSSGNGIDGTLEPAPTITPPLWLPSGGQVGGALQLDGVDDCVYIPNESRFDITDHVTVSAWIKVNAFDRDWQAIVTKGDSAWRLHRLRDTNSIAFNCNLYPDSWGAEGSINVNTGQWHHVAGVYDVTRAYLYVDGVLDNSEAAFGLIGTNDYPVMIGENAEQPGRFWNGLIDDVRIYTCALGPSEVYQLYSNICYVDADATGNNNGSSWTDAFNYLQDALAQQATIPCEIHVAEGTYKPDANSSNPSGTGDRTASFQLEYGVVIKGGYAGFGQPDPNARDCDLYETTLSGDIGTAVVNTDNSYHVVTSSECDLNTVLEGFTIAVGNANGPFPHDSGGGMLNYNSSPTVNNCTFTDNTVSNSGGGMYNLDNSSPTVTNCTFTDNTVGNSGGGMYNYSGSDPNVTNCIFTGNQAEWGGGVLNYNSNPELTDCTFTSNTASSNGGGMLNGVFSSPTVTNCTFSNNTAHSGHLGGGGMFNYDNSRPTVTNCTFTGNTTTEFGGGMFNAWDSNPTVTDCNFSGNSATSGGGMYNLTNSSPMVTNCTFSNNIADSNGGGMDNRVSSNPIVTNCTFSNNSAGWGGGVENYESSPIVTNCIFWNDTPDEISNISSSPIVTYSDVQGGWTDANNTNFDADPCFVDANNPDPNLVNLRLRPGSPCIDAGDNTAVPASVLKDLAGKLRYADDPCTTDTGNAGMTGRPVVDMGAYEFQGCGTTSQNLLANPGFEVGDATGWITNWGFDLTADTNEVHDGNYSGLASGRTASWQGAWQSLLGLMDDGKTYRISGWVRLQNETSDYVALTVKKTDSAGTNYYGIDNATGYDDQWVHLDGTLALDVIGQPTELYVYFEGPVQDVNFYVDDAEVTEVMGDMNHNGSVDFIDFSLFASYYGFDCSTQDCGRANLNDCDNTINEFDLIIFCNNWLIGAEPEL